MLGCILQKHYKKIGLQRVNKKNYTIASIQLAVQESSCSIIAN